ncbi:MAG: CopG family transcriptional regulator [Nitrospirales bacterium]|nr:ribbon-helix-helix domain-containing protein [Nitrospirales bacterium]
MRTTLTLDDDVSAKLKSLAKRTGKSFKETVNEAIRSGLTVIPTTQSPTSFRVVTRDLGNVQPGINLDNIAEVIEQAESPRHR